MTVTFITWLMIQHWEWVAGGINYTMTFLYYPALIIIFSAKPFVKLFDHKCVGVLGKITYDVYIWHAPCFLLLYIIPAVTGHYYNLLSLKAMLIYTLLMFVVGTMTYYLLEMPINKSTRRLLRKYI